MEVAAAAVVVAAASAAAAWRLKLCSPVSALFEQHKASQLGDSEVTQVRCFSDGPRSYTGVYSIRVVKGALLISGGPGNAEETVHLAGAQVVLQGNTVLLSPRLVPPLTLSFGGAAEAAVWADKLRNASQFSEQAKPQALTNQGNPQRVQSARIAELEARVSATLHAAVDRSKRIKELEAMVEEGKDRDQRIQELEEAVEETMQEASVRGERITELEHVLASRGGVPDLAASAVLQDAMRFAEQMLENRQEELAIDGTGAEELHDAVEAVKKAKPEVAGEVAELVNTLVGALRWPMVLRRRLVNAEKTVKEQKDLHTKTMMELRDLENRQTMSEMEKKQVEAEVVSLSRQLAIAEKTAEEALQRLQAIQNEGGSEDSSLKLEKAKRENAERMAAQLRERLQAAEAVAVQGAKQQRALSDAAHAEEVRALQRRQADTELQKLEAEKQATELRDMLSAAQKSADEAVAEQKQALEKVHANKLSTLQQLAAEADQQRDESEQKAGKLRQQLASAEQAIDEAVRQQKERLAAQHEEELNSLQQQHAFAQSQREQAVAQADELQERLQAAEQASTEAAEQHVAALCAADKSAVQQKQKLEAAFKAQLQDLRQCQVDTEAKQQAAERDSRELKGRLAIAEKAAEAAVGENKARESKHKADLRSLQDQVDLVDTKRERAELQAKALKQRLVDAEEAMDKAMVAQKALHGGTADQLHELHIQAQTQRDLAEARARDLAEQLAAAQRAADEAVAKQRETLDKEREEQVRGVRLQHAKAEVSLDQVEMRASDLRDRLQAAEAALGEQSARNKDLLEGARTHALGAPQEGAETGPDLLDEIMREKQNLSELERRLGAASVQSPWAGAKASAPRESLLEASKDLDLKLVAAERALEQAAPGAVAAASVPQAAPMTRGSRTQVMSSSSAAAGPMPAQARWAGSQPFVQAHDGQPPPGAEAGRPRPWKPAAADEQAAVLRHNSAKTAGTRQTTQQQAASMQGRQRLNMVPKAGMPPQQR